MILSTSQQATAQTGELKERNQIDAKYTWDLTAIYKTDADWEADFKAVEAMIPTLKGFEGKISKSAADLLTFFKTNEDLMKKLDNLGTYAMMSCDQDTRDQKYIGFRDRISDLGSRLGEAESWFSPELVSIPDATFEEWFKQNADLALYRQSINDQLRTRAHTLSPVEERILALSGQVAQTPANASTALRNTDIVFPTIKDDQGKDIKLSEGRYQALLESPNGEIRRNAATAMLNTYIQYKNTAASLMSGNVNKDIFYARARHYNSCLQASLDNDNIDTTVYKNLIETVHKNLSHLHKYVRLRKEALGLDSIHMYDFNVALFQESNVKVPYDHAVKTIQTALAPLGPQYLDPMNKGFESRWIDVYETKGKRSGAYSTGTFLSHPYMLLNYNDTQDDMFTLAHEMGHSMHTWFSTHTQPYVYSDYRIFVAEVASTFNEALLMDYLLKKEKDPKARLYLINQYIDNIRGTLITQTMFAEFELKMHEAAERGEPLTAENLSNMYRDVLTSYMGPDLTLDDFYAYTWIRIPHFYRNFYVYKYATSFAASQALSQKVLAKEKGAKESYIKFLSGGSSKYPVDLLKDAGVDMSKPEPVQASMNKLGQLVDEMEKLLVQTGRIKAPAKK
jgi:oligoendopeptidase F